MEKADRETRDFMNVESFSQLPFIRPAPPVKEKGTGAIRLFGKEFGGNTTKDDCSDSSDEINNINAQEEEETDKDNTAETSSRKFECHYCCRNFPTSQALGGHQNAHKRERQQAKRAHLQSAMVHAGDAAHHLYGLINYRSTLPPIPYHSFNNSISGGYGSNSRLYGTLNSHHQAQQQPINGSPLAMWRIPAAHSSSVFARPTSQNMQQQFSVFNSSKNDMKPLSSSSSISGVVPAGSQFRFGYESKPDMQDHVSLDLHL